MSQTNQNSFLDVETPTAESPAAQIVESPTVDSPELFDYEGPFSIGPIEAYKPDFNLFQRQRDRRDIANLYGSFDLGLDGIKFKKPDIDIDFDIPYPDIDLSEFGFELPEFSVDLKKEDLSQFFDLGFDFSTPDWAKQFMSKFSFDINQFIKDMDFNNMSASLPKFEGYGNAGKKAYSAVSQLTNFYRNPSLANAEKTVESIGNFSAALDKEGFDTGSIFGEKLTSLAPELASGLLDVGSVASLQSFIDNPTVTGAVSAYEGADRLLREYTDVEGLPGASSDIAKYAGQAVSVINAATAIDDFLKNPNVGSALAGSAAVANAVSSFTSLGAGVAGPPTATAAAASQAAATLGGAASFYAAVQLVRALTYDQDYSRSDGSVDYRGGRFETTFLNGADGGEYAYVHWADAHTYAATTTLNSLIDDYGFTVDQQKLNQTFRGYNKKSYITNNRQYALQGGRDASYSANDMVISLLKSGSLKPSGETPFDIVKSEGDFGTFIGELLAKTQNEAATRMYNQNGFTSQKYKRGAGLSRKIANQTYIPFASQQFAQNFIDERDIGLKKSGMQEIGSRKVAKTRSIPILGFNISGHSVNPDNSIKSTTTTYTVGEGTLPYRGKYTPQYTRTFSTEAEAKAFVSENSGKIDEGRRREGKGFTYYKNRTDYAYILHEGQYLIGERTVEI